MDRRAFLIAGSWSLAATGALAATRKIPAMPARTDALHQAITACERDSGGRLGVALLDTGSGLRFAYRGEERFPMCSTFKFLLAAAILTKVQAGKESLTRKLPVRAADILDHSPVARKHVGGQAAISELCEGAIIYSDNAAANLLLRTIGGPEGFTRFLRGMGDSVTRLDRWEPVMGEAAPGDQRDTTSPTAMLESLRKVTLGTVLAPPQRTRLTSWLIANKTGDARLRAGLPRGWRVGDKTGSGGHGTTNDVAIFWPPQRRPVLVTTYLTGSRLDDAGRNAVLARVGHAATGAIQ